MWAHCMTVQDYQSLINRGWRRSGHYCYKPDNKVTCCPLYTIKCDALNFKPSKSHKKVLKRMNKFLRDGKREAGEQSGDEGDRGGGGGGQENFPQAPCAPTADIQFNNLDLDHDMEDASLQGVSGASKVQPNTSETSQLDGGSGGGSLQAVKTTKVPAGADPARAPCKKAKQLRLERKLEKLAKSGQSLEQAKSQKQNNEKSLEDFLAEQPSDGAHTLKVS